MGIEKVADIREFVLLATLTPWSFHIDGCMSAIKSISIGPLLENLIRVDALRDCRLRIKITSDSYDSYTAASDMMNLVLSDLIKSKIHPRPIEVLDSICFTN